MSETVTPMNAEELKQIFSNTYEADRQLTSQLTDGNFAKAVSAAAVAMDILSSHANNQAEELMHLRTLEYSIRNNVLTEEGLQLHLDTLAALRQRQKQDASAKIEQYQAAQETSNTTG